MRHLNEGLISGTRSERILIGTQDGECGTFYKDLDSHCRSQFDAALVALAASVKANGEVFDAIKIFSEDEIGLYEKIERYNSLDILTAGDIKKKLVRRDENLLGLLHDYYIDMDSWVDASLENPEIRLTLRGYLKRRWDGYRGKVNAAVASAVTELDWLGGLIATWKDEARKREDEIRSRVDEEGAALSRGLKEKEAVLRDQEREVARKELEAQKALMSARKGEEEIRVARDDLASQEREPRRQRRRLNPGSNGSKLP
ncbi:MAG: hypothetical protein RQM90_15195 [Methanoculleus sp.]